MAHAWKMRALLYCTGITSSRYVRQASGWVSVCLGMIHRSLDLIGGRQPAVCVLSGVRVGRALQRREQRLLRWKLEVVCIVTVASKTEVLGHEADLRELRPE